MAIINGFVDWMNSWLWSPYLLPIILIGGGIFFTIRTGAVQIRLFPEMFKVVGEKPKDEDGIFDIVEMPITITIDAKEKFVGDKDPELTATVTDINGKKVDPKEIGLKLTRKAGEEAGVYEITAEFTNESYTLDKLVKANLTIKTKAPVTGDQNNMGLWLTLTILCAFILSFNVFMVLFRRKRSK